jgi:hypothetical protein
MATDLIVSGIGERSLCVQLTISNDSLLETKKNNWRDTMKTWGIKRAIFISYNPVSQTLNRLDSINPIVNYILERSDLLPNTCYIEESIDS